MLNFKTITFILIILIFVEGTAQTNDKWNIVDSALNLIKLTREDLKFRIDYEGPDEFRLNIVNHLMTNPMLTGPYIDSISKEIDTISITDVLKIMARELDFKSDNIKTDKGIKNIKEKTIIDELKEKLNNSINVFNSSFENLTDDEKEFILKNITQILKREENIEKLSALELREMEENEESRDSIFYNIIKKVNREKIIEAGIKLISFIEKFLINEESEETFFVDLTIPYIDTTGEIKIFIQGKENNYYDLSGNFIVIDPGGNDIYKTKNEAGSGFSIIIDFKGNDLYLTEEMGYWGGGLSGIDCLFDLEGNDNYFSGNNGLGAGVLGVGLLYDKEGNDFYKGDAVCEGASFLGIGLLRDISGNDVYNGHIYCQGFGYVGGFGLIDDWAGNDNYIASGSFTDIIRYEDHSVTLSQGFGFGSRIDWSGGIGFLFDHNGNDNYSADIYGQGSSYWFALGMLVDNSGNDNYYCYQYTHGAGIHLSIGALLDRQGDDSYSARGVAQGCGHDYAYGLLWDLKGDDSYSSYDLAQGAGNANGIGFIFDEGGNDSYAVRGWHNSQGYGDPRREYGSIGLLIDLNGKDRYSGNATGDGTFWIKSKYGIGLDIGGE